MKAIKSPNDSDTDWRAAALNTVREHLLNIDAKIVEEVKWRKPSNNMQGVPVWSRDGIICTGETYKDKVKLTFAKGAHLSDPNHLFNSSLDGNMRRAIDIFETSKLDPRAFEALVREAIEINGTSHKK